MVNCQSSCGSSARSSCHNAYDNWSEWNAISNCGSYGFGSSCPYSRWRHPIHCQQPYFTCAGSQDGPTLVIHQIVLEAGCEQSCTPRSFRIRVTGPSYPCGEIFTLRTGSCLELDEPLVISGLEAGVYRVEVLYDCPNQYQSTITGAQCGGYVNVASSVVPTVVTIVSRRQVCVRRNRCGCSW